MTKNRVTGVRRELDPALLALGLVNELDTDTMDTTAAQLERVVHLASECRTRIHQIDQLTKSRSPHVREVAETATTQLSNLLATPPPQASVPTPGLLFQAGRWVDEHLLSARSWAARIAAPITRTRPGRAGALHAHWPVAGLALTVIAAWALTQQNWVAALVLLVVRLSVSLALGESANLPYEGPTRAGTPTSVVYHCMAGHTSDTVALIGAAWVFIDIGAPAPAILTVLAIAAMPLASLLRVSSLQVGVQMVRLSLERVMRAGALLAGITAAAIFPTHPQLLVIAPLGALGYALIETARTRGRLRQGQAAFGGHMPDVVVTVAADDDTGRRTLTNNLDSYPAVTPLRRPA